MALTEAKPQISDELQKELEKSMEKGLIRVNYENLCYCVKLIHINA